MTRSFIKRVLTPGGISQNSVLIVGILALMVLAAADWRLGSEVLLHGLYVFPLAGIVFHSSQQNRRLFGYALTVVLQLFAIFSESLPVATKVTDALIAIASSSLVLLLARIARENYLETVELATRDALTGLHNRRYFDVTAESEFARQNRYGGTLSLAIIDLDNFKALNDTKGHKAGDAALILLADVLRDCTRKTDVIARLGGDEFAVLMPNSHLGDCDSFCQHLIAEIARRMADSDFSITASIGSITLEQISEYTLTASDMADKAMYKAKAMGKNCAVSF